jgi:hypothetical protein
MDPELCVRIKDLNPSLDLQITAERYSIVYGTGMS